MQESDLPERFPIPFGNSAVNPYINEIPTDSQIGINPGRASLTTGFPPANFTPVSGGGTPPFGGDFNGILYRATGWDRWFSAGGCVPYNADFAAAIGGYPKNAIVGTHSANAEFAGLRWMSTTDNNLTDPDAGGAGWVPIWSKPQVRVLTASGAFTTKLTDQMLALNRTTSLAASTTTLPTDAFVGYRVRISDVVGNFKDYPVTVTRPTGQTIAGLITITLNVNRQVGEFEYVGSNLWSVKL